MKDCANLVNGLHLVRHLEAGVDFVKDTDKILKMGALCINGDRRIDLLWNWSGTTMGGKQSNI